MKNNLAFIDWQNLHLWTSSENWKIDFKKFRVYLRDKFQVEEAYYFIWFISEEEQDLYSKLQKAWFIVVFREHSSELKWKKKWNVDVDIVFEIMKRIIDKDFDKIVLVTWDGDYIKLVNFLIQKDLLKRILFPSRKYSSLYNKIKKQYWMSLWLKEIKQKIAYSKEANELQKIKNKQKKEMS